MESGNADETDRTVIEENQQLDKVILVNQAETTEQTAIDDVKKVTDEVKTTGEENQKDTETVVLKETKKEETEGVEKDTETEETEVLAEGVVEKAESNESPNGKSVDSEVPKELTTVTEKTEPENSKKHPLMVDATVTEPESKKSKLDGEQEVIMDGEESSGWERPFPPEFYSEMETYECDAGPLWHFDDPYIIEMVQEGNPPKDVACVSMKRDKNKDA